MCNQKNNLFSLSLVTPLLSPLAQSSTEIWSKEVFTHPERALYNNQLESDNKRSINDKGTVLVPMMMDNTLVAFSTR